MRCVLEASALWPLLLARVGRCCLRGLVGSSCLSSFFICANLGVPEIEKCSIFLFSALTVIYRILNFLGTTTTLQCFVGEGDAFSSLLLFTPFLYIVVVLVVSSFIRHSVFTTLLHFTTLNG